jgi:hypothetical protein
MAYDNSRFFVFHVFRCLLTLYRWLKELCLLDSRDISRLIIPPIWICRGGNHILQYGYIFFFNSHSGGWNWVHSARRPVYCTCPGWLWWWRIWWNEDWQGKPKYSEETCSSATLSTTNQTWGTRVRTRAAAVGSHQLTAWAMARPTYILVRTNFYEMFWLHCKTVFGAILPLPPYL